MRSALVPLAAIAAAGALLSLPCLVYGLPAVGHDAPVHAVAYAQFSRQLFEGELYPRWLMDMNGGLGAPAMFYYPPGAYYASSLMRPLFADDPLGWRQLGAAAALALVASGATAFGWLRCRASRGAALAGALLYMALPYHLLVDLYLRAALAEYWAFVWSPLVLWQLERAARGARGAVPALALGSGLLAATHLITTLIVAPAVAALSLVLARGPRRAAVLGRIAAGLALGAGLSAPYWLPALTTLDWVLLPQVGFTGELSWERQFLFRADANHGFPELAPVLEEVTLLTAVLAGLGLALTCFRGVPNAHAALWSAVALGCLFMLTPASAPVWRALPPLQQIQFPWRFGSPLTLATAALASSGVAALPERGARRSARGAALLIAAVGAALLANALRVTAPAALRVSRADRTPAERALAGAPAHAQFWPVWSFRERPRLRQRLLAREPRFALLDPYRARFGARAPRARLDGSDGEIEVLRWRPRDIALRARSAAGGAAIVGQLYYPGWRARVAGEACCLPLAPSSPDGLVRVELPPGDRSVELRLRAGAAERAGTALGLAALLATAGLAAACFRPRESRA